MRIVEKIQRLIVERGFTQTSFEPMVGLSTNRISKWAGGQGEPTARQALRMARTLDVPIEYLIDDDLDEPPRRRESDRDRQVWEIVQRFGAERVYWALIEAGLTTGRTGESDSTGDSGRHPRSWRGNPMVPILIHVMRMGRGGWKALVPDPASQLRPATGQTQAEALGSLVMQSPGTFNIAGIDEVPDSEGLASGGFAPEAGPRS